MRMNGKTLFFNETDGKGIIITADRKKINFSVENWDDFDIMPSTGLEVVFDFEESKASNIMSKESFSLEEKENTTVPDSSNEDQKEDTVPAESILEDIPEVKNTLVAEETKVAKEDIEPSQENDSEETDSEEDEEHFEKDSEIEELDIEEELAEERPESITNTLNIATAVSNYFNVIKDNIDKRAKYKKVDGRLDYLTIRRFLWTTYNNLVDIDIQIITPKIKMLCDDLKEMGHVYDDFVRKTKYPPLAYEEVFLASQEEYQKIRDGAQSVVEKINRLKASEKQLGGIRGVKKQELEKSIRTPQFDALKNELKSLNGAYVDVVHMMAELDERYKLDMKLLTDFEKEYREDFYAVFAVQAQKYKDSLVDILNAQAFFFDAQQWNEAKNSKSVKAHFKKSSISGELNTKTYLKYFLSTQDQKKANEETKKLFELYDYLVSVQKDYIMVVVADAQDAMEIEMSIKSIDKSYDVKSFIDEIVAIKWAMKNNVKLLVVEDQLRKVRVEKFLDIYDKNILSMPKIILIGNKPSANTAPITKLVNSGASARVVAKSVQSLIESESNKSQEED